MAKDQPDAADQEGQAFAGSYNAPYLECSARLNKDVRKVRVLCESHPLWASVGMLTRGWGVCAWMCFAHSLDF